MSEVFLNYMPARKSSSHSASNRTQDIGYVRTIYGFKEFPL